MAVVESLAVFLGRARPARAALAKPDADLVTRTARGWEANPLVVIEREALTQVRHLAEQLGLSPVARTRLGMRGPERDMDAEIDAALGPRARSRVAESPQ